MNERAPGIWRFWIVGFAAVALAVGAGWAIGKFRSHGVEPTPAKTWAGQRGELAFAIYCASCHGPEGRGDGASAAGLRPPPRDFAARPWRLAVTRDAIRSVILDGIPGTAMPASRTALAMDDVEPLVDHVYHLATSRPPVMLEPTKEEILLRDAGFTDMRGIDPPALVLTDADGKAVKLADFKGRTVLLHFWGIGCVHCLKEMPRIQQMEASLVGRPFIALHVCTDTDDVKQSQQVANRAALGLRVFADLSGLGQAGFEVQTLPTVWLIGPDGKAIGRASGTRDWTARPLLRLIESSTTGIVGF